MGYDLHITRANDWIDSLEHPITHDEWLELVARDPHLTISELGHPASDGTGDGATVVWDGPSEHDDPWIAWRDGRLYSKNPDGPLSAKMWRIAEAFHARLVGDDGEHYATEQQAFEGTPDPHQFDDVTAAEQAEPKTLASRLTPPLMIISGLAILLIIIFTSGIPGGWRSLIPTIAIAAVIIAIFAITAIRGRTPMP